MYEILGIGIPEVVAYVQEVVSIQHVALLVDYDSERVD